MKGNRIVVMLMAFAMVTSVFMAMFIAIPNVKAYPPATTPGIDDWGNATTVLTYDAVNTVQPSFDTTGMTASTTYYLYKPAYNCTDTPSAKSVEWYERAMIVGGGGAATLITGISPGTVQLSGPILLDRAGMWIFDTNNPSQINGSDATTFKAFFWVNTSTVYTISTISDITYGDTGSKTITVLKVDQAAACYIDLIDPLGYPVFHARANEGTYTFGINHNITMSGTYTVRAYKDLDTPNSNEYTYKDEKDGTYSTVWNVNAGAGYNDTRAYGKNFTVLTNNTVYWAEDHYNYTRCGPWDPPEENATMQTFTVDKGKPIISLTNTTAYWGFESRIDVNVTAADGSGITDGWVRIKKVGNSTYLGNGALTDLAIGANGSTGNYSVIIPQLAAAWYSMDNGSWSVFFTKNASGAEIWNNSKLFTVTSATPPVRIIINSDNDSSTGTTIDKKISVPAYPGTGHTAPYQQISFSILGTDIADDQGRRYYGDDIANENWQNISVTGDILYPLDGTTLTHVNNGKGDWLANVIPTKPGGTITITIDWPGNNNGSASETINIINGTQVTPSFDSFTVGSDINLTVTVKDKDGDPVKSSHVWLFWKDGTYINDTTGDNSAGNGYGGVYTFWIPASTQGITAPENITIAASEPGQNFWGYANVLMEKNHNMIVNMTPTSSYAGDGTYYHITVSLVDGSGHPDKTTHGGLRVALYNETGVLVTGDDTWSTSGKYDITDEQIILSGGTYYIYAYNNTHDSQGKNATLTITKYAVTCSPSVLAWLIDTKTNVTFQVTPAGNGTLSVNNMSTTPEASIAGISPSSIPIENGIGTINNVNATTLGNVTFAYTPEDGQSRDADGLLRVTTATATPNPAAIYIGESTFVTITVTHPATGAALNDVRVGLDHGKALNETVLAKLPDDAHTDVNGMVTFSVTSEASGDVIIYIENETDPDNQFVITSAARKTMTLDLSDPSVNEGGTFTVSAKYNDVLITDATVTIKFGGETKTTTTGTLELTAPTVSTTVDYKITATAPGYSTATETIKVVNVPSLKITLTGTKGTDGKYSSPVTVTVSDDTGGLVTGATVTFSGQTLTTVNGQVSIAITAETSGAVTATFAGFKDATTESITIKPAGVPGFELLTLVAALGVAFILLRRRQK